MTAPICATHMALNCPICGPANAVPPHPSLTRAAEPVSTIVSESVDLGVVPVQARPAPARTDSKAQSIVNAAEEYARAADEVALLEDQKKDLEQKLAKIGERYNKAILNRNSKERALQALVGGSKTDA